MSSEDSWAEVAAELPSMVEEIDVECKRRSPRRGKDYYRRRREAIILNRVAQKKALKEAMEEARKKNPRPLPRDEDDDTEEEDYDETRALEQEQADRREMRMHRRGWKHFHGPYHGSFEDTTSLLPMRYTDGVIPSDADSEPVLEIFSIQVIEVKDGLKWPLPVYGHVAARDTIDNNRNILFYRERDNCQILTPKDSFLLLTGPSRPVMIIDQVTIEVDLKVKGRTESEDKVLCMKVFYKRRGDFITQRRCFSKRSTVEFAYAVIGDAVEATVASVKIISGSWPVHFRGLTISRTTSAVQKDIVLLDSQDGRMPITSDGSIELSRRVVGVEVGGELTVCMVASQGCSMFKEDKVVFPALKAGRSRAECNLGFCQVEVTVAWSLFTSMADQQQCMRAGIKNRLGLMANIIEAQGSTEQ